jgi:hypothetical protein
VRYALLLAAAIGLLLTRPAMATPCAGVDRALSETQKPALAREIGRQLGRAVIDVLRVFRDGRWAIFYVETQDSDPPFLFFSSDPANARYVTLWSGAAMRSEEAAMRRWVEKEAVGIPPRLAACFARYVTKGRNQ